jgi:predicted small metal-binding protein
MLLIDGVKYEERTPADEDELEQAVKEHAEDIFGEQSIYLDIKHKLKSKAGIGSIPDGYVIVFGKQPDWHIVEVELSSHPLYEHIVPQLIKFTSGIKNLSTQKEIASVLHDEISKDKVLTEKINSRIGSMEIYKFLSTLISHSPRLTILIDRETEELNEAVEGLKLETRAIKFQTFVREGGDIAQHAHLFEPLVPEESLLEELRRRFIERKPEIKSEKPTARYCKIAVGHRGVHLEWLIHERELGVELHMERPSREENLRLFDQILPKQAEIEKNMGEQLSYDPHWTNKWSRIYTVKEIKINEDFKEWAVETMIRFHNVFKPILDEIDS